MSSAKNKTISVLQRSIRSFSNSPSRKPLHLTGELRQSSPAPERKSRQSRKDFDLKDLSLDEDLIIISDPNNNNVKASTSKSKETDDEKSTKSKLKPQSISKRSQSATNYIDDKYEETSSDESEADDDFVPKQTETGKKGKSGKTSASKTNKPKKEVKRNAKDIKPTRVPKPSCGICGSKTRKLTRTECCGNLICGRDQPLGRFRPFFSFSAASCFSDHNKYTLCCFHFNEGLNSIYRFYFFQLNT